MASVDIGVFIPIGNNGWLISTNSPQYKPSFELNKQIVQKAESYGFDFALSMIKLRGFGAAVTTKIRLFASVAILTLPPPIVARMASTIDSVAPGRFGVNIVTGWQSAEYSQMGLWPGDEYYGYRYDYATEYVQVMKDLWKDGVSSLNGKHFQMEDCKLSPKPKDGKIDIVAAGQSGRGIEFASEYADYNFTLGVGINTPTEFAGATSRLVEAATKRGRDVGSYVLFTIITGETDEAAQAKWELYNEGVDVEALAWMKSQASKDTKADAHSTATFLGLPEGAVNLNMGTLIGSYETIATMLDEVAEVPGTKGIMLVFDEFLEGVENFGQKIQPLMKSRQGRI
ncbi:pyrimidine utilization protein A [Hypoxylon sp. FL1150]|nr:pyrimidine utilization protein A [Hypoxylon sp. FL1150]